MFFYKIVSVISPLLVVIICWRMRFTLLWFYAAAGFLSDVLSYCVVEKQFIGNVFILAEFLFISLYYRKQLYRNMTIFYSITGLLILFFAIRLNEKTIFGLNTSGAAIFCILYIVYGLLGFYKLLKNPEFIRLENSPVFLVNVSFFIYGSANCLLFLFATYLEQTNFKLLVNIWGGFFTTINILHYLLIGIALYKTKRTWTSPA